MLLLSTAVFFLKCTFLEFFKERKYYQSVKWFRFGSGPPSVGPDLGPNHSHGLCCL